MNDWLIDEWQGCYPSSWKGVIVPEAMTHPAKFSSRLIKVIYGHMLAEGWLQPGDLVIDPFGGVALGAVDAMRLGLRWRGIELEPKFADLGNQNIALWNKKYSRAPHWCPDAQLLQGDSRKLIQVLGQAEANVSSPPYAGSMGNAEHSGIDWSKQQDRETDHPHGWNGESYSTAGALSSPPYAEARIGQESGQEQAGRGDQYGATTGQLGAMKADGFDAVIGSPPFNQNNSNVTHGETKGFHSYDKNEAKNRMKRDYIYPETDGNLGNMNMDASIASPPFRQATGGTPEPKPGGSIDAALYARHSAGNANADGYGQTDGQLANDSGDDFWFAARQIVEQVYMVLRPGAHAVWVVKGFVKNKQLVDFPGQWQQLCESVGFTMVHEHHAMLVHHRGTSHTLEGGEVEHKTESKSFFRRLAEKKGSPPINYETILCMVKGE